MGALGHRSAVWAVVPLALVSGCGDLFHTTTWQARCEDPTDPPCAEAGATSAGQGGGGASAAATTTSASTAAAGGSGGAGAGGAGGSASAPCSGIADGVEFGGHCYVDVTTSTVTHSAARALCAALATSAGSPATLLVLDSAAEQDFVVGAFLAATSADQDAWLDLTCDEAAHPLLDECFCKPCADQATQDAKRASWTWIDGPAVLYADWLATNPNGDGRCAALTPDGTTWKFGDRNCGQTTFLSPTMVIRSYRTICEISR